MKVPRGVLFPVVLAGCLGATDPDVGPDLEFELGEEDPIAQQQSVEISSQGSSIIVTGRVWLPNTCYEITAALTVPDSTHFRLDIDATGLLGPYAVCFDVSMSFPYVARFAATRPGRYEVEVFHRMDGRTRIRVSKLLIL